MYPMFMPIIKIRKQFTTLIQSNLLPENCPANNNVW